MRTLLLTLGLAATAGMATADVPVLTVMTYDSFTTEYGPGPAVEKAFEATCGCDLRFVTAGDGAALLARIQLEGARSDASVVLGLDTSIAGAAAATGLFAPHGEVAASDLPVAWDDPVFVPYDWGWFAFVYDRTKLAAPPASFEALAASDLKVVIEDPRSSTPGLGLLLWVKDAYGEPRGGGLARARGQHRHRDAGLDRGLQPLPRRGGGHGAVLHHLARLPPDRRG